MILRGKPGLFDVLFTLRGSIVPQIWRRVVFVTLVAAGETELPAALQPVNFNLR